MQIKIDQSWQEVLGKEFEAPYFKELIQFVRAEYQTNRCFPPGNQIFSAFNHTPFDEVKVVIIGQDPYHGEGQANGLCFSVSDGIKPPPSLANIFKELKTDIGKPIPASGNLENWAKQGVLMLNATLTVRSGLPGSHQNKGWERFTDKVIETISNQKTDVVFILWGAFAQKKKIFLANGKHCVIESAHPSPFSVERGFYGSKPFSRTNGFLKSKGKKEIEW